MLKHCVDGTAVRRQPGDVAATDHDTTRVRALETRDQTQGRRLAAAARAEQGVEVAVLYTQVNVVDSRDAAVGLGDVLELDIELGTRGYLRSRDLSVTVGPLNSA